MTKLCGRISHFIAWCFVTFKNNSVLWTTAKLFLFVKNRIRLMGSWCSYLCYFWSLTLHFMFHLNIRPLAFSRLTWLIWLYASDVREVVIFFLREILDVNSNFLHSQGAWNWHLFWLFKLHLNFTRRLENRNGVSDIATAKGWLPWYSINHFNSDRWNHSFATFDIKGSVGKLFL